MDSSLSRKPYHTPEVIEMGKHSDLVEASFDSGIADGQLYTFGNPPMMVVLTDPISPPPGPIS
jgi:hypothetical protein